MDDGMTISETAALLKLSKWSVYQAIGAGRIPATRLWNRQLRISRAELESVLAAGRVGQRLP